MLWLTLALEWLLGDPRSDLHPVAILGRYASWVEQSCYADRVLWGALAWFIVMSSVCGSLWICSIGAANAGAWIETIWGALIVWISIGWRSLFEHVCAVERCEAHEERKAKVAMIVGRDLTQASAVDLRRATLESLAENASDSVVAPLFWGVLFGPLGAAVFRCVNTLDAIWGYRNARYLRFGRVAAYVDDVLCWVPARLTALAILLGAMRHPSSSMLDDARSHDSPNAGFPESALAHAINVKLGGPVQRSNGVEHRSWMGPAAACEPGESDLRSGIKVVQRALFICVTGSLIAW